MWYTQHPNVWNKWASRSLSSLVSTNAILQTYTSTECPPLYSRLVVQVPSLQTLNSEDHQLKWGEHQPSPGRFLENAGSSRLGWGRRVGKQQQHLGSADDDGTSCARRWGDTTSDEGPPPARTRPMTMGRCHQQVVTTTGEGQRP
jgi:hypothetical protein